MEGLVGRRYRDCWFDNYDLMNDESTEDRRWARDTVMKYSCALSRNKYLGQNLIMMGTVGTGKDHLAVSVIRAAMASGIQPRYVRGDVLCSLCRRHYIEANNEVPEDILNIDLLVISDIEPNPNKATDFEERVLMRLVDYRYQHMLPIVITSNQKSRSALSCIIGERTVSRLYEKAWLVPMEWSDYRGIA